MTIITIIEASVKNLIKNDDKNDEKNRLCTNKKIIIMS